MNNKEKIMLILINLLFAVAFIGGIIVVGAFTDDVWLMFTEIMLMIVILGIIYTYVSSIIFKDYIENYWREKNAEKESTKS